MRYSVLKRLGSKCSSSFKLSSNSLLCQRLLVTQTQSNVRSMSESVLGATDSDIILHSPRPPIPSVDGLTIPELIWANLRIKEKEVSIECSITGQKLTHGDVYKQSRSFASALLKLGLKRSDCVTVILPNSIHFPAILLGILEAGGACSMANPAYTADEIVRQLKISESKVAISQIQHLSILRQALKECPALKSIILVGDAADGCHSYSEMTKADSYGANFLRGTDIDTKDFVAILPFSSGTTGPPKGVELTHHNICSNLEQYTAPGCAEINRLENGLGQDRLLGVLPYFHIYGMTCIVLASQLTGNHILNIPKFSSQTFLKNIRYLKPQLMTLVPPIVSFLVNHPETTAKDFEQVRTVQAGAAPLGPTLANKLYEKAGKNIFVQEMYGLTEMSPGALALERKFGRTKPGSCGTLIASTIGKVVDPDTGKGLGPGLRGELCITGPQLMRGYFKNPEATADCVDADRWFHTGDIATYDEDGCFSIVDRMKELIKVKGLQVAPAELEDLLRRHPGVSDCAVIGVPDDKAGELPRAYIVRKGNDLNEADVNKFLDGKVSKHKELKGGIEFVDVIPKAPSGKILRRELKQQFISKYGRE